MRIAQVAPLAEAVPPNLYGGTERVVSWLTEELVRQGYDVTLFASADSRTSAKLVTCAPTALRLAGFNDHTASLLVMLDQIRRHAAEFDVIHFHIDLLQFPLFKQIFSKCLTTMHGRLDLPDFHPVYRAFPAMPLVSISDSQRKPMPPVNWRATIHHGLPASLHPLNKRGGDYLVFLGRMSPEKRPDRAIEVAIRSGVPLKMAAKVDRADREYFEHKIEPQLDHPLVEFVGEVDDAGKRDLLSGALALIFPIDWPEPFGLVMIEAMAMGTPTIAWRSGSVPEVIDEGTSGVVVDSVQEAVQSLDRIRSMDRAMVRRCFEARFTAEQMANSYLRVYANLSLRRPGLLGSAGVIDEVKNLGVTPGIILPTALPPNSTLSAHDIEST
jgi:glycosyltransferase involved in cell wall biosynthesis